MDIDMGCSKRTITDVGTLMTMGKNKLKWSWSGAGWGGDWGSFIVARMNNINRSPLSIF